MGPWPGWVRAPVSLGSVVPSFGSNAHDTRDNDAYTLVDAEAHYPVAGRPDRHQRHQSVRQGLPDHPDWLHLPWRRAPLDRHRALPLVGHAKSVGAGRTFATRVPCCLAVAVRLAATCGCRDHSQAGRGARLVAGGNTLALGEAPNSPHRLTACRRRSSRPADRAPSRAAGPAGTRSHPGQQAAGASPCGPSGLPAPAARRVSSGPSRGKRRWPSRQVPRPGGCSRR